MIEGIPSAVAPLVDKNHNKLDVHCDPDIGKMNSDSLKIRQAILNLVSNAAKFTEKGEIVLSAERSVVNNEELLAFTVSDTGIGMTVEQQQKVFEPFSQADVSTTRKYGGTGLGLSITQQFCHLLGGDIEVTS